MRRALLLLMCVLPCSPALARGQQADSATSDSVFLQAQRLATEGRGDSARALVQRQLDAASRGSPRYVEALYWRAVVAATAADAERDLRTIIIEYPVSPWSADALMRLAQLEMTRGENDQALTHLERVIVEHPDNPSRARAGFWMARALFEQGNAPKACARLADAMRATPATQVELRNQMDYLDQRCVGVDTTATVATAKRESTSAPPRRITPSSAAQQSAPPSPATTRATGTQPTAAARQQFTIQVAAYSTRAAAEQLRASLAAQGHQARVLGSAAPYRVRVGRYDTRAAADSALRRLREKHSSAFVTEAEPR